MFLQMLISLEFLLWLVSLLLLPSPTAVDVPSYIGVANVANVANVPAHAVINQLFRLSDYRTNNSFRIKEPNYWTIDYWNKKTSIAQLGCSIAQLVVRWLAVW
jgi:hypothetical protein